MGARLKQGPDVIDLSEPAVVHFYEDESHAGPEDESHTNRGIVFPAGSVLDLFQQVVVLGGIHELLRLARLGRDTEARRGVDPVPDDRNGGDLHEWWMRQAKADADTVVPKAKEYSANDLVVIGAGLPGVGNNPADQAEAGVAFYALGKAARLTGALGEGRLPSLDTWDDLSIYAMMGRRIRETGQWGL